MITGNGIVGGLYCKSDGCVDPTGLTNSFAKGAKMAGATVVEDCPVEKIVRVEPDALNLDCLIV